MERAVRLARWYQEEVPRNADGVHLFRPDLPQFRTTVLIDSLYHVPPFLAELDRMTGERRWSDAALEGWFGHARALDSGQGPLLCHNLESGSGRHRGYGWGRGNGWALYGLLLVIDALESDHPRYDEAVDRFRQLAGSIVELQDASGFWRTLLHDREAYLEASTAGFYGSIFTKATRDGLLEARFAEAAERVWSALASRLDEEGGLTGVSAVTWAQNLPTEELALYKAMPTEVNVWGQGCALRFAAERLRDSARQQAEP